MKSPFGGDPHFNNVVLQLPLRSHLRDESKAQHAVTVGGNTTNKNDAAYFDGSGDYLAFSDSPAFEIGTGEFCIEAWMCLTGYSASYSGLYEAAIVTKDSASARSYKFTVTGTAAAWTGLQMTLFTPGGTPSASTATFTFALNQWYHVVTQRRGTTIAFYVDGILISSGTNATEARDAAISLHVGQEGFTGFEYYFPGYLRDVRFTKSLVRY